MTIENYIQAGLQHLGVYSETISDIIYFLALLVIIGMINWITHVLTRQWLARFVLKLTKRTATNWDDLMFSQRFFNRLGLHHHTNRIQGVRVDSIFLPHATDQRLDHALLPAHRVEYFGRYQPDIRQLPDSQRPPDQGIHSSDQDIFLLCRHHHHYQYTA